MAPLIDLREHFGIWERCAGSMFWRELDLPEHSRILVNPVDGVMITGFDYPQVGGPALQAIVRDASKVTTKMMEEAYRANYPWVRRILNQFFSGLWMLERGHIQETPASFFVKHYADQTQAYKESGEGHSDKTGKDELLTATKRVLGVIGQPVVSLQKIILKDEWSELLEGYGILEC